MSPRNPTWAHQALTDAVGRACERYRAMEKDEFLAAVVKIGKTVEQRRPIPPTTHMDTIMVRAAEAGSVEAAAALIVMGGKQAKIKRALKGLVAGSEVISDSLVECALTHMLEEYAAEEVRAGRMKLVRDGPLGEKLYAFVDAPDTGATS